jgi:hypothetical protein
MAAGSQGENGKIALLVIKVKIRKKENIKVGKPE